MSTGEQAQAASQPAADAKVEEVSLLDQVISATKQTERSRTEDLMKTLVDQTLASLATEASAYRRYEQVVAEHAAKRLGVSPVLSDERNIGSSPSAPRTSPSS